MLDWKNTSQEELKLKQSMEWLFSKHPKLLDFLFESSSPRLRDEPQKLLTEAEFFHLEKELSFRLRWTYGMVAEKHCSSM